MWVVGGLCRARTSEAGLSFDTAIRRTGFWALRLPPPLLVLAEMVLMREATALRFEIRVLVRVGVAAMLGSVIAGTLGLSVWYGMVGWGVGVGVVDVSADGEAEIGCVQLEAKGVYLQV